MRALARLSGTPARAYGSLLAVALALIFYRLGARGLFEPDEGRYAEIPREMIALSDWITPHLNYVPFLEKPPLAYWLTAGAYLLFGETEFAARLPSAAFFLLTVLATAYFGRRMLGAAAGWLGGLVLATALLPLWLGRTVTLDGIVAACVTISIFAFHRALEPEVSRAVGARADFDAPSGTKRADDERRGAWLFAGYAFAALGTLAKGPVAAVLPALVIGLHLILSGRIREIGRLRLVPGAALYLALVAPWFILVGRENEGFTRFYFLRETLERYTSAKVHTQRGWIGYYLPIVALGLVPWVLVLPRAIRDAWRSRAAGAGGPGGFLLLWAGSVFLFFSFAGSKLPGYVLPLFPPLALLVARSILAGLSEGASEGDRAGRLFAGGLRPWLRASLAYPVILGAGAIVTALIWRARDIPGGGALAIAGAVCLAGGAAGFRFARRATAPALLACVLGSALLVHPVIVAVSDSLAHRYSVAPLAREAAAHIAPGDPVVQYRGFARGLSFYLKRRIMLFQSMSSDLFVGYRKLPKAERSRWFIQDDLHLARLLAQPRRVFVVTSLQDLPALRKGYPGLRMLARTTRYALLSNR
jgi:4-amino-4-deoxy-L-arabinose transferase-like glycosyltransferase